MKRPFVTISYAQTLDGRTATRTGSSQWISGSESLAFTHQLRASHDAILVGSGTVLRDNPRLTVRLAHGRDPIRVIVDTRLRIADTAAVLANGAATNTILAVGPHADAERVAAVEQQGALVLSLPAAEGGIDLVALLEHLAHRGIRSLMVEGGATIITALLRLRVADRLAVTIAPKVLGRGLAGVGDLGISDLDQSIVIDDLAITPYGRDIVIDGRLSYPEAQ